MIGFALGLERERNDRRTILVDISSSKQVRIMMVESLGLGYTVPYSYSPFSQPVFLSWQSNEKVGEAE